MANQAIADTSQISNNLRYTNTPGEYKSGASGDKQNSNVNNPYCPNTPNNPNNGQNSNSFRQTGMLGTKKFKTTKSSRKLFYLNIAERCANDRNLSGDKSKILVHNFMKNSISNSVNSVQNSKNSMASVMNHTPIDEKGEMSYNVLDFIAKKLIKKTDSGKNKANVLNSTNPVNNQNLVQNLMIGKFIPSFQKSSQKSEDKDSQKTNSNSLYSVSGINISNSSKLNITK
jgi:hypothetical protein